MKLRLVISSLLVTCALGTAVLCGLHLKNFGKTFAAQLEAAAQSGIAQNETWDAATQTVLETWSRNEAFLHILLPHPNINELEWAVSALPDYCRQREPELYLEQCVRALSCLETILEMEKPRLGNIF
jgi:hypothetical protein